MIALQGNFRYSFLLGVFAAVNPCGFVMLPSYLMYFLGVDAQHRDEPAPTESAGRRHD